METKWGALLVDLLTIHKNFNMVDFGSSALDISEYRWQSHFADMDLVVEKLRGLIVIPKADIAAHKGDPVNR